MERFSKGYLPHKVLMAISINTRKRLLRLLLSSLGFGFTNHEIEINNLGLLITRMNLIHPILLDIGAHKGFYSNVFLNKYADSKSYMVEPNPLVKPELKNIKTRFPNRAEIHSVAISASTGPRNFYSNQESSEQSSLLLPSMQKDQFVETVVCSVTITQLMNDIGHVDVIKLDVEGLEMEILESYFTTYVGKLAPIIQFEFGQFSRTLGQSIFDFYNLFQTFGYELWLSTPSGPHKVKKESLIDIDLVTNYFATQVRDDGKWRKTET